ncbi:cupin domain-containing protein [Candidatus Woesearchaeota archaeon]|nr:cupin domain-containing protein [Candidatus Woesearchaeota archaeon]
MQFPNEGIFSTVLVKSENYNHTLMCLAKGSGIDTHTSTKAGAVLVLKGKGEFLLADEKISLKPGTFIFMPPNTSHSLAAFEDLAILLLLVKE